MKRVKSTLLAVCGIAIVVVAILAMAVSAFGQYAPPEIEEGPTLPPVGDPEPPVEASCGVVTFTTSTSVVVAPGGSVHVAGSFADADGGWLVGQLSWDGGDAVANPFDLTITAPSTEGTYYIYLGDEDMSCPRYTVTVTVATPTIVTDTQTSNTNSGTATPTPSAAGGTSVTSADLPDNMPNTGWEVIPFLLTGGGLVGTGGWLYRRKEG